VRVKHFSIPVSHRKSSLTGTSSINKNHLFSFSAIFPRRFFKKRSTNTGGYTLIELIVVLILLGLMLGLTVPRFRQALLSDSLDATALRLIGLVQDLRERAISEQVVYVLHIDIPSRKIWAFANSASEEEQETARERAIELPADVRVEDIWSWNSGKLYDEATIRFSRKGYIEQSIIHLQSGDGRQLSLELTPFLGSIKTHEGYVDFNRG
jgi:prepilin-type N-terminal cleavage/methylation domain-containing protein